MKTIKWSMIELLIDTAKSISAWTDSCSEFWIIFFGSFPLETKAFSSLNKKKKIQTFNFTWIRRSLGFQSSINILVGTGLSRFHFWYNTQNIFSTSSYWFLLRCITDWNCWHEEIQKAFFFFAFQLNLCHNLIIMLKLVSLCSWLINGFIVC